MDDFYKIEQDGRTYYVDKSLELPETITIDKAKFVSDLPDKELIIKEY